MTWQLSFGMSSKELNELQLGRHPVCIVIHNGKKGEATPWVDRHIVFYAKSGLGVQGDDVLCHSMDKLRTVWEKTVLIACPGASRQTHGDRSRTAESGARER